MIHKNKFVLLLVCFILCNFIFSGCGGGSSVTSPVIPTMQPNTPTPSTPEIPTAPPQPVDSVTGYVLYKTGGEASLNDIILIVSSTQPSIENYSPLSSAKVYLANNPSIETTTDGTGRFTLNNVPYSQEDIQTKIIVETNALSSKDLNTVQRQFGVVTGPDGQVKGVKTIPLSTMPVSPGDNRQVQGYGINNQNQVVRPNQGVWSGTIGQIDTNTGIFKAPVSSGSGTITYTDQGISSVINVEVVSNSSFGSIIGTVTYSNGSPASGVMVSVDGLTVASKTDTGGNYTLQNIPSGQRIVRAEVNGVEAGHGSGNVTGGQSVTVNISLNINPNTPVISSIYPSSGPAGSAVTVSGNNFGTVHGTVSFNGITAQITSWNNSAVTAIVPEGAATGNVTLSTSGGQSNGLTFTVTAQGPTPTYTPTPAGPTPTFTPTPAEITPTPTPAKSWNASSRVDNIWSTGPGGIALDPSGNAYVIMNGVTGSTAGSPAGVYFSYRPANGSWAGTQRVDDGPKANSLPFTSILPRIKVDSSGNAYAIWSDKRNGGDASINTDIYFSYRPSGGSWSANVRVDDTGFYPAESYKANNPSISVDSSGNAYAIWGDSRSGYNIYFSYRPRGGTWGANIKVTNTNTVNINGDRPSIALDASGNAYAVWSDIASGFSALYFSYRPSGGSWNTPGKVPGTDYGFTPDLKVDASGNAYLVYINSNSGNNDVSFLYRPTGGSWSTPVLLETTPYASVEPSIALDPSNTPYVVWRISQSGPGVGTIYFTYRLPDGSWSTNSTVNDVVGALPFINFDLAGKAYLVWGGINLGPENTYFSIRQ